MPRAAVGKGPASRTLSGFDDRRRSVRVTIARRVNGFDVLKKVLRRFERFSEHSCLRFNSSWNPVHGHGR